MDATRNREVTIVVAEDDPDDRFLIEEAFRENRLKNEVIFVENGEELLQYLRREERWKRLAGTDPPGLILLDLNMPKMDGREALRHIKQDAALRTIPVVVLTTSQAEEDVARTYCAGVNSYISKPVTFESLVQVVRTLATYWFEIVKLPGA